MNLRSFAAAIGASVLLAVSACEQQTTNPSSYPGTGYSGSGYPGNGPSGTSTGANPNSPENNMSSGNSSSHPMR